MVKLKTDLERNNRTAMKAHLITAVVMVMFCVLETLQKARGAGYLIGMMVLGLGPVLAEFLFWKRDHETKAIKHLVAIGFALFYTVALFTARSVMVYAFVIPMIMVIIIYNDARYFIMINAGTIIESVLISILGAQTGKFGYLGLDAAIIQVVVMVLVGVFSIMAAKTINANMVQKVEVVAAEQKKSEELLESVSEASEKLKGGIDGIYQELERLNSSSHNTKRAMEEVSNGAQDSAEAVQHQLSQTEEIQKKMEVVDAASANISENMQKTLTVLEEGSRDMQQLRKQVDASVQNSEEAAGKLEQLDAYMKEMNSIVELIKGITSQTSLLALNASIEAARAGEAGRGFSVVATEISSMATQTQNATVHITELIQNVSGAIGEVVDVMHQMMDGINEEKQGTQNAVESFEAIRTSTFAIRDHVDEMTQNVNELKTANAEIVESIQTISAISEEVSAHAGTTLDAEKENAEILDSIAEKMHELTQLTV